MHEPLNCTVVVVGSSVVKPGHTQSRTGGSGCVLSRGATVPFLDQRLRAFSTWKPTQPAALLQAPEPFMREDAEASAEKNKFGNNTNFSVFQSGELAMSGMSALQQATDTSKIDFN